MLSASHKDAVILVWLDSKDISAIGALAESENLGPVFLSSTLLGQGMYEIPDKFRKSAYITYPYRLPEEFVRLQSVSATGRSNLTLADYTITRGKTNLNLMLTTKAIFMLKGYFVRDRFLEVIDMMKDEVMLPIYPRLSFGPGQRYLRKAAISSALERERTLR